MCEMCDPKTPMATRTDMMIGYLTHKYRDKLTEKQLDNDCNYIIGLMETDTILQEWEVGQLVLALRTVSESLIYQMLTDLDLHEYQPGV